MKYVIYTRVSTDKQAEKGFGLPAQLDICERYIKSQGGVPNKPFVDDGYSGTLRIKQRKNLQEAIASLCPGDVFVVAKRDRLGRTQAVNEEIENLILEKGCKLVSASGDFIYDSMPESFLMRGMLDTFSDYERRIISKRTKAALDVKKRMGERTGRIPYGYRLKSGTKLLEEDEVEQSNIKTIVQLRKSSLPYREICEELTKMGILNRKNQEWKRICVYELVKKWTISCLQPGLM